MQSKISVIRAIRFQKKAYMLSLGRRTTNAYNYMQSKISVIRAIRVQKKAYMLSLGRRTTNVLLFFLNTNLTDLTNLDTACSVNQVID